MSSVVTLSVWPTWAVPVITGLPVAGSGWGSSSSIVTGVAHLERVQTRSGPIWLDSPSALNQDLAPVEHIFFTHPDFMGACNQYREIWSAEVHLHRLDAANPLVR